MSKVLRFGNVSRKKWIALIGAGYSYPGMIDLVVRATTLDVLFLSQVMVSQNRGTPPTHPFSTTYSNKSTKFGGFPIRNDQVMYDS